MVLPIRWNNWPTAECRSPCICQPTSSVYMFAVGPSSQHRNLMSPQQAGMRIHT